MDSNDVILVDLSWNIDVICGDKKGELQVTPIPSLNMRVVLVRPKVPYIQSEPWIYPTCLTHRDIFLYVYIL